MTFTFCGVGSDIVTITNKKEGVGDDVGIMDEEHEDEKENLGLVKSTVHTFEDQYEIPQIQITPSFSNFLSAPGIIFKIWAVCCCIVYIHL